MDVIKELYTHCVIFIVSLVIGAGLWLGFKYFAFLFYALCRA